MKIPLFDIDQTLLGGKNSLGDESFNYVFTKVFNTPQAKASDMVLHGKIDPQIIIEILQLHGWDSAKVEEKMQEAITTQQKYFVDNFPKHSISYSLKNGVNEILEKLKKAGFLMGVLTGNLEQIGWIKLKHMKLADYFSFGAFGSMARKRPELVIKALELAKKIKPETQLSDLVIIGDAPLDVACAKQARISVIGIGAGSFSKQELLQKGADIAVDSLEDQKPILDFLSQ